MRKLVLLFCLLLAPEMQALAENMPVHASSIQVSAAWARATVGNLGSGIIYATIVNTGASDDRLVAASTPAAGTVELHQTVEHDGIAQMPPVKAITVKAGGKAFLSPGGYHVMLENLKQPLKEGQTFPVTLTFEKAGPVQAMVTVTAIGASGPPGSAAPADSMDGMGNMDGMKM